MPYYENGYEDYYNEPSEFEQMIYELRESLKKSIKEEHQEKMKKLKEENDSLQDIKVNFEKIKQDYKNKERELGYERAQLKNTIRKERLSELLNDSMIEYYTVEWKYNYIPKCDKCDENRRIYYNTPLGNRVHEDCSCNQRYMYFNPMPIILKSFSIHNGKGMAHYKVKEYSRNEYLEYYDGSISGDKLVTNEDNFEEIRYYGAMFETEELAQKYCDFRNKKSKDEAYSSHKSSEVDYEFDRDIE